MTRYRRVINAKTGKESRVQFTPEEEIARDRREEESMLKKKVRNEERKALKDRKDALQVKLNLTDDEMEILGKVRNIR